MHKIILTGLLIFISTISKTQNISPLKYSTDHNVYDLASAGDTLIAAGYFLHVGVYTGGFAEMTGTSDQPNLTTEKLDYNVYISTIKQQILFLP